jgi:hypothetical protein
VLIGEAANINFSIFGLTLQRLQHLSYHTSGEHADITPDEFMLKYELYSMLSQECVYFNSYSAI